MAAYKQPIGYYNHNGFPVQFTLRSGRAAPVALNQGQPIVDRATQHLIPPGQEELDEEVRMGTISYIYADNPKHKEFWDWNKKADQKRGVVFKGPAGGAMEPQVEKTSTSPMKKKAQAAPDVTVSAGQAPVNTKVLEEAERQRAAKRNAPVPKQTAPAAQRPLDIAGAGDGAPGPEEQQDEEGQDEEQEQDEPTAQASEPIIRPGENLDGWLQRNVEAGRAEILGNNYIKYDGQNFKSKKALAKYLELIMSKQTQLTPSGPG